MAGEANRRTIRRGDQRQAGHFSEKWHRPVIVGSVHEREPSGARPDFFDSNDIKLDPGRTARNGSPQPHVNQFGSPRVLTLSFPHVGRGYCD